MATMYQRILLKTLDFMGSPGPVAYEVAGWPDEALRDLDGTDERFGLQGTAFWPLVLVDPPLDPATETLTNAIVGRVADRAAFRVTAMRGKRALSADELAARRSSAVAAAVEAVNAERDRRLTSGFTYDFGGAIGAKTLQSRDAEDKVNWLISRGAYRDAVAAGHGAVPGAQFRSADNTTFTVTVAAGLAALVAMETWGAAVMARSWALKDALAAGADPVGFDVTTGWPG